SRRLSSAPPISITGPAPPVATGGREAADDVMERSVAAARRDSVRTDASLRGAGRPKDQLIVWLDNVDDAFDALLDQDLEAVAGHQQVTRLSPVDERELHPAGRPGQPDGGGRIEP